MNLRDTALAVFAAGFTCLSCYAKADPASERMVAKAEDALRGDNIVAEKEFTNAEGIGKPTEQTWAFSTICKVAEKPAEVFARLAKSGSAYGMIGLRKYNLELFREMMNQYPEVPIIYHVSHDAFFMEEPRDFLTRLLRDEKMSIFQQLIWTELPDWMNTVRVRQPGKNL